MQKRKAQPLASLLPLIFLFILTACNRNDAKEITTLRIGVLPILDTLPLYVAETEGYFTEQGLQVQLIPVASAAERDQLMQAGQIDGIINDLVSVILYNKEETQVLAVRYAMQATPTHPQFRILAAANTQIEGPADLQGIAVGISEGTIIQYITERILTSEGLTEEDFDEIAIPKISDRMALLESGGLEAATLPEPLASLSVQKGARIVIDDRYYPEYSHSVFSFRKESIDDNPESIRQFLSAIEKASVEINKDKDQWENLLIEKTLIPSPLIDSYLLPDYPGAAVPTEAQFTDVVQWALKEGLITTEVSYASSIDPSLLP